MIIIPLPSAWQGKRRERIARPMKSMLKIRHLRIMATLVYIGAPFVLRQLVALICTHEMLDTTPNLAGVEYFAGEHELTKEQWAAD